MHIHPVFVTSFLFFGSLIFSLVSLFKDKRITQILKSNWQCIVILLVLNLLFKVPFSGSFFNGLEYEDAYVYKASARFLNYKEGFDVDPFLTTSCTMGSLENCQEFGTYSGHVIGYPFIINLVYRAAGYNPDTANYISLGFSVLTVVLLFLIAMLIQDARSFAIISCLVFISVPVFNVFASTSLVEPTSNTYITLALLVYIAYLHHPNEVANGSFSKFVRWGSLFLTLLFVLLIKRENLSLALCLPFGTLLYLFLNGENLNEETKKSIRSRLLSCIPIIVCACLFYFLPMDILETIRIEQIEIGRSTFSIDYFLDLMPLFLRSLFHFDWYFIFSMFLLIGYCCFSRRNLSVYPIIVFSVYFFLYTTHHRSYYYIKAGIVNEFETHRYLTGLMSIYSLIVAMSIFPILELARDNVQRIWPRARSIVVVLFLAGSVTLIICFFLTQRLRTDLIREEYLTRIQPVVDSIKCIENIEAPVLITEDSLLYQIYGDENLNIIDFALLSEDNIRRNLDKLIQDGFVIFVEKDKKNAFLSRERWRKQIGYLNSKKKVLLCDGERRDITYRIYRILND